MRLYIPPRFATADKCRQRLVDHLFPGLALTGLLWHCASMQRPSAKAGGCFLTLFILAGFVAGLAIDNPMKGVLAGTAVGALAAVLLWLIDRRRSG